MKCFLFKGKHKGGKIIKIKENILHSSLLPYSIMLTLVIVFFFPIIFQGQTFYAFDTLFNYLPWSSLNKDIKVNNPLITDPVNALYPTNFYIPHYHYKKSITHGSLPLWNNANFCGTPSLPYSSPLFFLFYTFFPLPLAHDLLLFCLLFGIGIFTYLYLKEIGLKKIPSLLGSLSWMFNGYIMVWFEFEHVPMMALTLSAVLYFIERWWKKRGTFSFLGLICALSFTLCTGYAHLVIYQIIFIGFYVLYRLYLTMRENVQEKKVLFKLMLGISLAVIISIIISANFFITHYILNKDIQRQPIPYSELFKKTGQVLPPYLTTILFPHLFGNPVLKKNFIPRKYKSQHYNNYNELCLYSGIITLFLACAGIPYFKRKQYISFYSITALAMLLMAMGCIAYYPFARFIPGLSLSTPTRILYLFGFALSMLAAFGMDLILSEDIKNKVPFFITWILILVVAILIIIFLKNIQSHYSLSSNIIVKPLLIIVSTFSILTSLLLARHTKYTPFLLVCVILLLAYDLLTFGRFYNTTSPKELNFPSTEAIRFLQKDTSLYRIMTMGPFLHNSFSPFDIEDIGGYSSFYPHRYGEFLYLTQNKSNIPLPKEFSRWTWFSNFGSPLLDLINTKYLLLPPKAEIEAPQLKLIYDREIKIYQNLSVFPRIFFVPHYELATSSQEAFNLLSKLSRQDFSQKVILESLPPADFLESHNDWRQNPKTLITIKKYTSNEIHLDINCDSKGFLVMSDNYHPGWRASVDNEKTKLYRANYIMRALPIKEGKHNIVFTFSPRLLLFGFGVTLIGWILLIIVIVLCSIPQNIFNQRIFRI